MSGMVGGLLNGVLSVFFLNLFFGGRVGWGWTAELWSFVAEIQGLFGSSHPENRHSGSVNCFSAAFYSAMFLNVEVQSKKTPNYSCNQSFNQLFFKVHLLKRQSPKFKLKNQK